MGRFEMREQGLSDGCALPSPPVVPGQGSQVRLDWRQEWPYSIWPWWSEEQRWLSTKRREELTKDHHWQRVCCTIGQRHFLCLGCGLQRASAALKPNGSSFQCVMELPSLFVRRILLMGENPAGFLPIKKNTHILIIENVRSIPTGSDFSANGNSIINTLDGRHPEPASK